MPTRHQPDAEHGRAAREKPEDRECPEQAGLGPVALAYAAGYAIGYFPPGAPGGAGIREVLLVLMLSAALDPGLVAIAAVIQRLGYVAAEAGLWALGRMRGTPPVPMV